MRLVNGYRFMWYLNTKPSITNSNISNSLNLDASPIGEWWYFFDKQTAFD